MKTNTYQLESINLIESFFKREPEILYESDEFSSNIDINSGYNIKNNKLLVMLGIEFYAGTPEKKQIIISVKMLGVFKQLDTEGISIDKFAKINAPAIIFPFIREHVATLSLKAGIHPILLPPINFVKLAEEKQDG
jgi:preprotein translocase subunit SecB